MGHKFKGENRAYGEENRVTLCYKYFKYSPNIQEEQFNLLLY